MTPDPARALDSEQLFLAYQESREMLRRVTRERNALIAVSVSLAIEDDEDPRCLAILEDRSLLARIPEEAIRSTEEGLLAPYLDLPADLGA